VKEELAKEAADILEQITEATCAIGVLRKEKQDKERETMVIVRENEERVKQLRFAESVLQDKINRLVTVKSLHSRAVADLGREQALLQKLETEESNEAHDFSKLIAQKEELVKKTEDTIANHQTVMDQAAQEAKLCSFWVNGFSPSGLRSFMLDYVTPILNDRAKYYSELLTNGEMTVTFSTKSTLKSGTEKDKFSITCQQAHGSASYRGSSAGERARADLVIAMALGDLAQFRTTKQLPWRFLDEPFESIDRSGTEAIVKLLNDQKSRYKTVFVVTHKPDFKEMFSQQITIVKENGKSTLYEEADRQRSKQDSKAPGS
jgi:DNA repair exonuclease SbcCD ATPase subunit